MVDTHPRAHTHTHAHIHTHTHCAPQAKMQMVNRNMAGITKQLEKVGGRAHRPPGTPSTRRLGRGGNGPSCPFTGPPPSLKHPPHILMFG